MDSTQTTEATEVNTDAQAETVESQATEAQGRVYTQQEFDDAMAKMKHATLNKALKPYQELGDIDELRSLKQQAEQAKQEEAMKRGEFEKILQDKMASKDAEIKQRDAIISEYKVDTPLLNAAAKYRSVNPEQVKALLKQNVRLGEGGEVEVIGQDGSVRYNDSGQAIGVDDLVKEFLDSNPHFVQPTPSTTNTKSSINNSKEALDVSKLDMSNPEHRKAYAEYKEQRRRA